MRLKAIVQSVVLGAQGLLINFMGSVFQSGVLYGRLASLTFGTTIAVDLSTGNNFTFNATTNAAHALGAPSGGVLPTGGNQLFSVTERNTSGGAIATMTFNAAYKLGAAWTAPANGLSRTIWFLWNGTNAVEVGRTAADVTN